MLRSTSRGARRSRFKAISRPSLELPGSNRSTKPSSCNRRLAATPLLLVSRFSAQLRRSNWAGRAGRQRSWQSLRSSTCNLSLRCLSKELPRCWFSSRQLKVCLVCDSPFTEAQPQWIPAQGELGELGPSLDSHPTKASAVARARAARAQGNPGSGGPNGGQCPGAVEPQLLADMGVQHLQNGLF